jgi:hypothetical protein
MLGIGSSMSIAIGSYVSRLRPRWESIQLSLAFTATLNAYDVDALVDLFTEEDAGPTVTADRSAWQKFEIRLWALRQVEAGIRMEAHDYRVTQHGAACRADVYRDDWSALGLTSLAVTNSIWLHKGRLADFTSRLTKPGDLLRLGRLWQPGVVPERPTKITCFVSACAHAPPLNLVG